MKSAVVTAAASRNGLAAPLASDRNRVAHLLRRAGFGYSPDDLDLYAGLGVAGAVDRLIDFDAVPDSTDERIEKLGLDLYDAGQLQRWWLLRMIYSRRPLQEKMALFWHGLLVSGLNKVGIMKPDPNAPEAPKPPILMLDQIQFFRQHALADFGAIVKGISRDPAMVSYLDNRDNRKGKPNENYARELMELFTLGTTGPAGQPNFTEEDVREAARAFTGWGLNGQRQFAFNRNQHDNDQKTFLGQTGNFDGDAVVDMIVAHPSCAYYVTGRLFEFFAHDRPSLATLAPFVEVFRSSGGSIKEVVQALFTSPVFYSEAAYRAKVKAPVEFLAGVCRALGIETDAFGLPAYTQRMGQTLFNPPNVAGWPGGAQWLSSGFWLERVNVANRLLSIRKDDRTQPVDLQALLGRFDVDSAERAVDSFLGFLVDGQVRPEQRQVLLDFVTQGNLWPKPGQPLSGSLSAVDRKVRSLIYLIMAMPEYQLA